MSARRRRAKFTGGDVYSPEQIARIRESGRIAADAITLVGEHIRPGVTTEELDRIAHDYVVSHDAYPSTLGYRGYPKSICSSVNEVICHGIPDDTVLEDGDIVNIDITAFKNSVHGDTNRTFIVGTASTEVTELVERTREALNRGIKAVAPGRQVNVIGRAIESYARRFGYGVVRDFTGHGVGSKRSIRASSSRTTTPRPSSTPSWRSAWSSRSSQCSPSAPTNGTCGRMTGP
jgi:methionyl aminopeptidase